MFTRRNLRRLRTFGALAAAWFLTVAPVWAQAAKEATLPSKSYAVQYFFVVLVVALGILVVVRPAGRTTDFTPTSKD